MKYLIAIFIVVFTQGCSTQQITLDQLMRTSYDIGCEERGMVDFEPLNHFQKENLAKDCEKKAKEFDLHQTGIYRDDMEVYYKDLDQVNRK